MDFSHEIIEISSDEDEFIDLKMPNETVAHSGAEKNGDLLPGSSLCVLEDDDCLILDGAPESLVTISDYTELGGEILDEMLIVGEKGQFACRDYPHPRYLCAKFFFSTTPHQKYCDMCHCYVCDCPAPCKFWESHCSSTHKEHHWRFERHLFRRRKKENQLFSVKPSFFCPKSPISNHVPSFLPPNDKAKSILHPIPIKHFSTKPAPTSPDLLVSKFPSSLLSNEPKLVHHCQDHSSSEIAPPRPKDILCEIYKLYPVVISCRRKMPPSFCPDELSDAGQDD